MMDIEKKVLDRVREKVMAIALQLEGYVKDNVPVAFGVLANSITTSGDAMMGEAVEVGSPLDYASYPEWGTGPHWPPFEPIRRWVEKKLQPHILAVGITPKGKPTGKVTKQLRGDRREMAIRKLAFQIQRKIAREGTKAQRYIRGALEKMDLEFVEVHDPRGSYYDVDMTSILETAFEESVEEISGELGL